MLAICLLVYWYLFKPGQKFWTLSTLKDEFQDFELATFGFPFCINLGEVFASVPAPWRKKNMKNKYNLRPNLYTIFRFEFAQKTPHGQLVHFSLVEIVDYHDSVAGCGR